ncbi:MAG: H-X9-DG-CTERM domain-containing protein [Armatimonadia bacterium]
MQFIKHHAIMFVILLAIFAVVGIIVGPAMVPSRHHGPSGCTSNLRVLSKAILAYESDYNGHLPNALTWPSDLCRYVETERLYHCPEDRRKGERSYEMLQRWSYQHLSDADAHRTILLYEIGKSGPEYRHNGGMNVGHGDGHVWWYSHAKMTPEIILRGVLEEEKP